MATETVRPMPDTYFRLIRRFPLAHLRNEEELDAATALMHELSARELDAGEAAYFEILCDLVGAYEDEHHPIPDASETEVLRYLMDTKPISQSELADTVGIARSTVSAVLSGSRSLTRQQVQKLAAFFQVSPAVFLPRVTPDASH